LHEASLRKFFNDKVDEVIRVDNWLVVRVLLTPLEARKEKALTGLTPPAEAAASQKWKIIYLQVLNNSPIGNRVIKSSYLTKRVE